MALNGSFGPMQIASAFEWQPDPFELRTKYGQDQMTHCRPVIWNSRMLASLMSAVAPLQRT